MIAAEVVNKNSIKDVIEIDNLTVRYGKKVALSNVSFKITEGSVYALLGRNGAGKSSAIRCLLGQQKPTSGSVTLFGKNVWSQRRSVMQKIGVVPEEPNAPPEMTPSQIATFCSQLYTKWDSKNVAERLKRFGVPINTQFGQLSKGQKCQVMLALALGHSPSLLVLDDPTLGLDVVARREFFEEVIAELADNGITILITTHDLSGIENIASHVGIIKSGNLLLSEEIEALKDRVRRIRYIGSGKDLIKASAPQLQGFQTLSISSDSWGTEAVVKDFNEKKIEKLKLSGASTPEVTSLSLEEIFTAIVSE